MENVCNQKITPFLKGLVEVKLENLHKVTCNNDNDVELYSSIKKESDNYFSTVAVKEEVDDIEDVLIASGSASLKLEPESSAFELKHFPVNTNMQGIVEFSLMDLNKSNDYSTEPTVRDLKVEESDTVSYEDKKFDVAFFEEWQIKNEEVDFKAEELEQSGTGVLVNCFGKERYEDYSVKEENESYDRATQRRNIQKPTTHYIKPGQVFKCDQCDYQTSHKRYLKSHNIRYKNPEEIDLFKCDLCAYQTIYKCTLKNHNLRHKNPDDAKKFKCDLCDYQTPYKHLLSRHELRHKNPEDINMFKCDQCDYQSREKGKLKRHAFRHKSSKDIYIFSCDHCDYQTFDKSNLNKHLLRHKNVEEINLFKCDQCDYKTLNKSHLKMHVLRHKNPEDVMFKCDYCNYQTIQKGNLNRHILRRHKKSQTC